MAEKRKGRPPVDPDQAPARVNLTLSAVQYDRLYRRAQATDTSIPTLIRQDLVLAARWRQRTRNGDT